MHKIIVTFHIPFNYLQAVDMTDRKKCLEKIHTGNLLNSTKFYVCKNKNDDHFKNVMSM